MRNPFHATFGVSPPLLVGRDQALEEFVEALEDGGGYVGGRSASISPESVGLSRVVSV